MPVTCPHCRREIKLRRAKPGKFLINCPKCNGQVVIVVPDDPSEPPVAKLLKAKTETPGATPSKTKPAPTPAASGPPPHDPEVTGDYRESRDPSTHASPVPAAETRRPKSETPPVRPAETRRKPAADAETAASAEPGATSRAAGDATKPDRVRAGAIPHRLDGYEVIDALGEGGMGAVYLGRQVSLDRKVALKVMNPKLARDPAFVARFTREAYAAAQLTHHNVVQIYDIGAQDDIHFFSMEYVRGQSLADLAHKQQRLDAEVAAGYALQAARGLKFGHDLGMIHRDVKPHNLLLNDHGVVKVADLGLVKLPDLPDPSGEGSPSAVTPAGSGSVTVAGSALGTPAYMAPEQARDAAHVDARADVYALGCTLYRLIAGQVPFEGKTALEVITRHATEPVKPPEALSPRVPKSLSSIVLRMLAKRPEDRFQDMGGVVTALEKYLGVSPAGTFSPREEDANALEDSVKAFNDAPLSRIRSQAALGFLGGCAFLVVLSLLFGRLLLAGGFLGLAVLTPLCYFVINGFTEKTLLFQKARGLVFGARVVDWLTWAGGALFALLLLYLVGLLWVWVIFCVAAAALAVGFHYLVVRRLAAQRQPALDAAERLCRGMRLKGVDEEAVRQFVYKYSGKRWEEFYEALFGYEAKLAAREWGRGELGKAREKFAAWREPLIAWIDAKQEARRQAKERKVLAAVEAKSLEAAGASAADARRKADEMAGALVDQAAEVKRHRQVDRQIMKALLEAARRPELAPVRRRRGPSLGRRIANIALGPRLRFLAGAALLTGCLLWVHQNELLTATQLKESASGVLDVKDATDVNAVGEKISQAVSGLRLPTKDTKPLSLPGLPDALAERFNSINPGVAGLILILSAFWASWTLGALIWPAALVAFAGPALGIPALGPVPAEYSSLAVAGALAVVGFLFLRNRR